MEDLMSLAQLISLNEHELWAFFSDMHEQGVVPDDEFYDVLLGICGNVKIIFPFWLKYNDDVNKSDKWIMDRPNRLCIRFGKKEYHVVDVVLEIDRRKRIMRNSIRKSFTEVDPNESKSRCQAFGIAYEGFGQSA